MPDQQKYLTHWQASDDIEARLGALRVNLQLAHLARTNYPVARGVVAYSIPSLKDCLIASVDTKSTDAEAVYQLSETCVLYVGTGHGNMGVRCFARSPERAKQTLEMIEELIPREVVNDDPDIIPVTFWANTDRGPTSRRRELDAEAWPTIEGNYPGRSGAQLDEMMRAFRPGYGGQLLLWHGEPGTGKTTALRTLTRQWRDWCDMHYIMDPEAFFAGDAAYLMQVLMDGEADGLAVMDDSPPDPEAKPPRWRVLVLEDCGELLSITARREMGQGLSRLLNACDGLIGRGLRVLVLITTNEPMSKLHEAVSRPGRCAVNIEFESFDTEAGRDWLYDRGAAFVTPPESPSLAELYAHLQGHRVGDAERQVTGFR